MQSTLISITTPGKTSGGEAGDKAMQEVNGVMVKDMKKRSSEKELEEKSKKEVAEEIYGKPIMRVIGGVADKWERVAK